MPRRQEPNYKGLSPWFGLRPIQAYIANRSDLYPLVAAHSLMDNLAMFERWTNGSLLLVPPDRRALDSDVCNLVFP